MTNTSSARADTKADERFAIEHFFIEREAPKPGRKRKKKPTVKVPARPRRFRINRLEGGFSLTPPAATGENAGDRDGEPAVAVEPGAFTPFAVGIRAAYDVRSGSAINSWSPFDFDMAKRPIAVEHRGVEIRRSEGNRMIVVVREPDFHVGVRGFDRNRDLFIDARIIREKPGDDQEV